MPDKSYSNTKAIETDFLKVKGNLISWQNTMIQISSISMISTAEVAKNPFPILSIVLFIVGILCVKFISALAGLAGIAASIIWIIAWNSKRQKLSELKKLNIMLNSGSVYTIIFNSRDFLDKVIGVLSDILADPDRNDNIIFNIRDNTFQQDSSVIKA